MGVGGGVGRKEIRNKSYTFREATNKIVGEINSHRDFLIFNFYNNYSFDLFQGPCDQFEEN